MLWFVDSWLLEGASSCVYAAEGMTLFVYQASNMAPPNINEYFMFCPCCHCLLRGVPPNDDSASNTLLSFIISYFLYIHTLHVPVFDNWCAKIFTWPWSCWLKVHFIVISIWKEFKQSTTFLFLTNFFLLSVSDLSKTSHSFNNIGAVHSCQNLNGCKCTKHTFSGPPPSKGVHINIFQMENCA